MLLLLFYLNQNKDKEAADNNLMNPSETSAIQQSHSLFFPTHTDTSNSLHFYFPASDPPVIFIYLCNFVFLEDLSWVKRGPMRYRECSNVLNPLTETAPGQNLTLRGRTVIESNWGML